MSKNRLSRGFTLMEMAVVLAISAILVSIAYPSYISSVRKSRRVEALDSLMRIQLEQERYRSNNPSYGTLAQLGMSATTSGGLYTLSITAPSASGYTAAATAVAGKSQTGDKSYGVSCATLRVNQDEPVFTPAEQKACWSK